MNIIKKISEELKLKETQVSSAVKLIDEDNTIPFIARYRKEVTGYLTDVDLRNIFDRLNYLRNLEERINTVLNSINEQGKLTDELKEDILNVETLSELEDIYRPFKPKRKTRASIAKEKGLEPVSEYIKLGKDDGKFNEFLAKFINEEKGVNTIEDVLNGAKDILAEEISDNATYRQFIKNGIYKDGLLTSIEIKKDEKDTYAQYANYEELIKKIPPHRILALYRGEKEGCLKVNLKYENDYELFYMYLFTEIAKKNDFKDILGKVIKDSLTRLIYPSLDNEIRAQLFEKAEDESIIVFKKNLKALLLYPPLKNKFVLGFDPGFRTGCKYALVNPQGIPLKIGVSYITSNDEKKVNQSILELTNLLKENTIDYIALGNGTASRESEAILSKIVKDNNFKTKIFIVNESGASVYSASKLGEQEFKELSVEKRSAISLARRLQDPLNELVKIEPKAIGVGQYQHDMNQTKLSNALNGVVEDCVNTVGVNLNNASVSILKYVSGINKTIANNIYEYLKTHKFKNRKELKNIKGLGEKAFIQCAGFLRIYDGDEVLDETNIHPESYGVAKYILNKYAIDLKNDSSEIKELKVKKVNKDEVIKKFNVGEATLEDILKEIVKPGRDIREDVKIVELNNDVKDIKDLKEGMILNGTIRNIMDFGMFVDINVHQDGLVHISEVSDKYVKNISDLYNINDVVKVKVIGLDVERKRIGLSIKQAK